jgi:hypothetical protein
LPVHPAPSYSHGGHATQKKSPTLTVNARKESISRLETPHGDISIPWHLIHSAKETAPFTSEHTESGKKGSVSDPRLKDHKHTSWEESLLSADVNNPWLSRFKKYSKNSEDVGLQCSPTSQGSSIRQGGIKSGGDILKVEQRKTSSSPWRNERVALQRSKPVVNSTPSPIAVSGGGDMASPVRAVSTKLLNLNDSTTIEELKNREKKNNNMSKDVQNRDNTSHKQKKESLSATTAAAPSDRGSANETRTHLQIRKKSDKQKGKESAKVKKNTSTTPVHVNDHLQNTSNSAAAEFPTKGSEKPSSRYVSSDEKSSFDINVNENKVVSQKRSPSKHGADDYENISDHRGKEPSTTHEMAEDKPMVATAHQCSARIPSSDVAKKMQTNSSKERATHEHGREKQRDSKQHLERKSHSGSDKGKEKHKRHADSESGKIRKSHKEDVSREFSRRLDDPRCEARRCDKDRSSKAPHAPKSYLGDAKLGDSKKDHTTCDEVRKEPATYETLSHRKEISNTKPTDRSGQNNLSKEISDTSICSSIYATDSMVKQSNKSVGTGSLTPNGNRHSTSTEMVNTDPPTGREGIETGVDIRSNTILTSKPAPEIVMDKTHKMNESARMGSSDATERIPETKADQSHASQIAGVGKSQNRKILSFSPKAVMSSSSQGVIMVAAENDSTGPALVNGATCNLTCLDPRVEAAIKNGQRTQIAGPIPYRNTDAATVTAGTTSSSSVNKRQNTHTSGTNTPTMTLDTGNASSGQTTQVTMVTSPATTNSPSHLKVKQQQKTLKSVGKSTPPLVLLAQTQLAGSHNSLLRKGGTSPVARGTVPPTKTNQPGLERTTGQGSPLLPQQSQTRDGIQDHRSSPAKAIYSKGELVHTSTSTAGPVRAAQPEISRSRRADRLIQYNVEKSNYQITLPEHTDRIHKHGTPFPKSKSSKNATLPNTDFPAQQSTAVHTAKSSNGRPGVGRFTERQGTMKYNEFSCPAPKVSIHSL